VLLHAHWERKPPSPGESNAKTLVVSFICRCCCLASFDEDEDPLTYTFVVVPPTGCVRLLLMVCLAVSMSLRGVCHTYHTQGLGHDNHRCVCVWGLPCLAWYPRGAGTQSAQHCPPFLRPCHLRAARRSCSPCRA
jgi:hypothetical protein